MMGEENEQFTMKALFREIAGIKHMQKETLASNKNVNEKLDKIQNAVEPMIQVVAKHTHELKYLDYEKRRKNLIIFGISENEGEIVRDLENKILHLVVHTLGVSDFSLYELDFIRRIGKSRSSAPRPVIMAFTTQRRKFEILKSKSKLKGKNIYIHEDTAPEIREKEKNLRGEMMRLRGEGKYAVIRSGRIITYDKVQTEESSSRAFNKRALSESPNETYTHSKRVNRIEPGITGGADVMEHESLTDEELFSTQDAIGVEQTSSNVKVLSDPSSSPAVLRQSRLSSVLPSASGSSNAGRALTQPSIESFLQHENQIPKN
ncbi:hypothetical protein M8J76_012200 [Diaphorina citri]|nr:hypothetical protein M8J76_012200 [Diaphorina citri]